MSELNNVQIFFTISVIWSLLLIIYDVIMVKKGIYHKWLKKRHSFDSKKYRALTFAIDIIIAILMLLIIRLMVYAGTVTGKYLFFNYIFGSILILLIPAWLILIHMSRSAIDQDDNKKLRK